MITNILHNIFNILRVCNNYTFKLLNYLRIFIYNCNPNICISYDSIIESGAVIKVQWGGKITIGKHCYISKNATLLTHGGLIQIGNFSTVNPFAIIYGQSKTIIGDHVRIATHAVIIPSNHRFEDTSKPIWQQGLILKGIIIEDDVWIGAGAKILDGVTIKNGCVIGANAVITKSTDSYGIYIGIPGRKIKSRI